MHMATAAALAQTAHPHPNPRVGAVIVKDGVVIGRGFHTRPGADHAEIAAMAGLGEELAGSTMYVTLEPCSHHGRTPPCADAIIAAGIDRVFVGEGDPDSRVSGRGVARLRNAGIEVTEEALDGPSVDPSYMHHRRTGRAMVTLKAALTLDGQLAAVDGTSQWITSEEARADAHAARGRSDAVLVGAGTLIADDPLLDVRLPGYDGPQPRPIVVAGTRPLPPSLRIWGRNPVVVTSRPWDGPGEAMRVGGVDGKIDLMHALQAIGDAGYLDVLVEGGAGLAGSLWEANLVDRGLFYLGAKIAGGQGMGLFSGAFATLADARAITITAARMVGPDVVIEFTTE